MKQVFPLAGIRGSKVYMVGIKGVGMTALTEILLSRGAIVSGSDTKELFFTDNILKRLNVPYREGFAKNNISRELDLVIFSAAYSPDTHCELQEAQRLKIPLLIYPEALGYISALSDASGISGVHGKTTTTAMCGTILKELNLPITVLAGSEVPTFENRSALIVGNKYFVAETCEYKRHFLHFQPQRIVITNIEEDHLDYYKDFADILNAFVVFARKLKKGGTLIYHADDKGACMAIEEIKRWRKDLKIIPYGNNAEGPFKIVRIKIGVGKTQFRVKDFNIDFQIRIPALHSVYNACAALILALDILQKERGKATLKDIKAIQKALSGFRGSRRRCEIIGKEAGILFMDDYAHHPTAIRKTLEGIREYYPHYRLVVDFMSHTYSRTKALLKEFATSFSSAHEVILHKIYASAREKNTGEISGQALYNEVYKNHPNVKYFKEVKEALPYLKNHLNKDYLFLTMGAGDNWKLSHELYSYFKCMKSSLEKTKKNK